VPLEGDASISRVNETNLGNYVCDAFLRSVTKAVAAKAGGNVTICFMNAGGIRTGYKVCAIDSLRQPTCGKCIVSCMISIAAEVTLVD
jgi:hypothetical protein